MVGNLTTDPVLKQLDDDRKVCQLRLAVNDQKDQPMFIDVATFGAQADACARYLTKGRAVAVTGRLVYREWDDNGTRRSRRDVNRRVAIRVAILVLKTARTPPLPGSRTW